MAKTKTPFFSLASHGSIASILTTQKGKSVTHVREKPIPAYRRTLPQIYQRWLYEDYAYLWRQQSQATRDAYRSTGVRHHLTAFQYWMSYQLANLPDIVASWHLDERAGPTAFDSSRNTNNATIIGASSVDGLIDTALHFDGINDQLNPPVDFLSQLTDGTISFFFYPYASGDIFTYFFNALNNIAIELDAARRFYIRGRLGAAYQYLIRTPSFPYNAWYHFAWTKVGNTHAIYINGVSQPLTWLVSVDRSFYFSNIPTPCSSHFSRAYYLAWLKANLDNIIINNRSLHLTEILRHAERRYPPL